MVCNLKYKFSPGCNVTVAWWAVGWYVPQSCVDVHSSVTTGGVGAGHLVIFKDTDVEVYSSIPPYISSIA